MESTDAALAERGEGMGVAHLAEKTAGAPEAAPTVRERGGWLALATVIDILVVEQPAAVRRTLCARLAVEADMAVVGEAEDVASAVSLAQARPPHVILLDAEMPHLALAEAVQTLRREVRRAALVVLTLHTAAVACALGAAAAVVGKHEGTKALVAAIRRAATGGPPD